VLIPKPKGAQAIPIKQTIGGPPSEDILQKHLEKAYDNFGRIIELNWTLPDPDTLFQLQIMCDPQGGEPIWTLIKGPPPPPPSMPGEFRPRYVQPEPAWSHQTGYVSLIADTCLIESGGKVDENVSIAESVIGIKGAAALPGSISNYKPMIFGVTAQAPVYGAPEPSPAAVQPWLPEQPGAIQPWSPEQQAAIQSEQPGAIQPGQPGAIQPWSPEQQQGIQPGQPQPAAIQSSVPETPTTGDLSKVAASQLVLSIHANQMTGCLRFLGDGEQQGEIYFAAGEPVHAVAPGTQGDNGFIDLLTWQKGKFSFLFSEGSEQTTISKNFEQLLAAAKNVSDQVRALQFAGISLESKLIRKQMLSSEAEFEQLLASRGVPVDMAMQKQLFLGADGTVSTLQILRHIPLARAQYIALLYNLVVCDLITG
jgi:Domain of unknown function (DUF4388)